MARVLIVDANADAGGHVASLLEGQGYFCQPLHSLEEAIAVLQQSYFDAVVIEGAFADQGGLLILEEMQRYDPRLPILLISAEGNKQSAAEIHRKGVSYIRKEHIEQDLVPALGRMMGLRPSDRRFPLLARCWLGGESVFQLDNSTELIGPLVGHLQDQLAILNFGDECTLMRVGVALTEALENAVYHGNFELDSALRQGDNSAWNTELQQRKNRAPYSERKVDITARLSSHKMEITIIDEGPGFDVTRIPNPTHVCSLEKACGRGIHLMRALMDEVIYGGRGNQVRLVKHSPKHQPGRTDLPSETHPSDSFLKQMAPTPSASS